MIRTLISHGCRINDYIYLIGTPLHLAIRQNEIPVVALLLSKGANIEEPIRVLAENPWHSSSDITPLMLAAGSLNNTTPMVRFLVSRGAKIDERTYHGDTALHFAAGSHNLDNVRFLLDRGLAVGSQTDDGWSPLHAAVNSYFAGGSYAATVRFLLDRGANPRAKDSKGRTALSVFDQRASELQNISRSAKEKLEWLRSYDQLREWKQVWNGLDADVEATRKLLTLRP
jgi:ankyrin repeat protein